jgi:hypothetical protein
MATRTFCIFTTAPRPAAAPAEQCERPRKVDRPADRQQMEDDLVVIADQGLDARGSGSSRARRPGSS